MWPIVLDDIMQHRIGRVNFKWVIRINFPGIRIWIQERKSRGGFNNISSSNIWSIITFFRLHLLSMYTTFRGMTGRLLLDGNVSRNIIYPFTRWALKIPFVLVWFDFVIIWFLWASPFWSFLVCIPFPMQWSTCRMLWLLFDWLISHMIFGSGELFTILSR